MICMTFGKNTSKLSTKYLKEQSTCLASTSEHDGADEAALLTVY